MALPIILIVAIVVAAIVIPISLFMIIILFRVNEWMCFAMERDDEGNVVKTQQGDEIEFEIREIIKEQEKKRQTQASLQFGCDMPIVNRFSLETGPSASSKQLQFFASEMPMNFQRRAQQQQQQQQQQSFVIDVGANTFHHKNHSSEMPIIHRKHPAVSASPHGSHGSGHHYDDLSSPSQRQRRHSNVHAVARTTEEYSGSGNSGLVRNDSGLETGSIKGSLKGSLKGNGNGGMLSPNVNTPRSHRGSSHASGASGATKNRQLHHHGIDFPIVSGGLRAQRDAAISVSQAGSIRSRGGTTPTAVPIPLASKQRENNVVLISSPSGSNQISNSHHHHHTDSPHTSLARDLSNDALSPRHTTRRQHSTILDPGGLGDILDPHNSDIISVESRGTASQSHRKLRPSNPHNHQLPRVVNNNRRDTHTPRGSVIGVNTHRSGGTPIAVVGSEGAIVAVDNDEEHGPWKRVVMNQQSYWVNTETMESSWTLPAAGKKESSNMFDKPE